MKNSTSPRGSRRSTVAIAVAVVALVAATTGTAYAAVAARNSVVSKSIKNGEVKTLDIAAGAVTSARIKDGAITGTDIGLDQITDAHLATAAVGGDQLAFITSVEYASASVQDADGTTNGGTHGIAQVTANCPAGTRIISGGTRWVQASNANNYDRNVYIQSSYIEGNAFHARGIVDFGAAGNIKLQAEAYCLTGGNPIFTAQ